MNGLQVDSGLAWVRNLDNDEMWYSRELLDLLGFDHESPSPTWLEFVSAIEVDDREAWLRVSSRQGEVQGCDSTTPKECDCRIRTSNGETVSGRIRCEMVFGRGSASALLNGWISLDAVARDNVLSHKLMDLLPCMVFLKDEMFRFVYVNKYMADMIGMSRREIYGKSDKELFGDTRQVNSFVEADKRVVANRTEIVIPDEPLTVGQRQVYLATRKVPVAVSDLEGRTLVLGVAIDITENSRHQRCVHTMLNSTEVGILVSDSNGVVCAVNEQAHRMVRIDDRENVVGKNVQDVLERIGVQIEDVLGEAGRNVVQGDRVLHVSSGGMQTEEGGQVLVMKDVTDIAAANEQLVRKQEILESILQALGQFVTVKDKAGRYMLANTAYCRRFRCNPIELMGKTDFEVVDEETANRWKSTDMLCIENNDSLHLEDFVDVDGQKIKLKVVKKPLHGTKQHGSEREVVGVVTISEEIHDLSDRRDGGSMRHGHA